MHWPLPQAGCPQTSLWCSPPDSTSSQGDPRQRDLLLRHCCFFLLGRNTLCQGSPVGFLSGFIPGKGNEDIRVCLDLRFSAGVGEALWRSPSSVVTQSSALSHLEISRPAPVNTPRCMGLSILASSMIFEHLTECFHRWGHCSEWPELKATSLLSVNPKHLNNTLYFPGKRLLSISTEGIPCLVLFRTFGKVVHHCRKWHEQCPHHSRNPSLHTAKLCGPALGAPRFTKSLGLHSPSWNVLTYFFQIWSCWVLACWNTPYFIVSYFPFEFYFASLLWWLLIHKRNWFLLVLEARNPRSVFQLIWFLVKAISLACRWPPSHYCPHMGFPQCQYRERRGKSHLVSHLLRTPTPFYQGPTFMTF